MDQDWTELAWQTQRYNSAKDAYGNTTEGIIYCYRCEHSDDMAIRKVINQTIDKAVSLFPNNVWDQSRYMLFKWDSDNKLLRIVITGDDKIVESPDSVQCEIIAYQTATDQEISQQHDNIQYWIRDHLTTCSAFFSYSLIAVFYDQFRDTISLL